MIDSAYYI
jgi:hypothetical protein